MLFAQRIPVYITAHRNALLLHFFMPVMALFTKRLERARPELALITPVRFDVVNNIRRSGFPLLFTHSTKRVF
jgi:hypothetical protein